MNRQTVISNSTRIGGLRHGHESGPERGAYEKHYPFNEEDCVPHVPQSAPPSSVPSCVRRSLSRWATRCGRSPSQSCSDPISSTDENCLANFAKLVGRRCPSSSERLRIRMTLVGQAWSPSYRRPLTTSEGCPYVELHIRGVAGRRASRADRAFAPL